MLDLNDVRVFTKVAEIRSVTAAARSLRMPKSSVSRDLARLEAALGVRLLQRTTRRIGLTEAGQTFYQYCERILRDVEEAESVVSQLRTEPRGHLLVSSPITFGQFLLGRLLVEFVERYPNVTVALQLESRQVDVVGEEFDVAIRIGRLAESSLIARRLTIMPMHLCASPKYASVHGLPAKPDDLARHTMVSVSARDRIWRLRNAAGEHYDVPITPRIVVNDPGAVREAVLAGGGLGWLPRLVCAEDLDSGRLLGVELAGWSFPADDVHALFASNRSLSPKVRAFIDFLAEHFSSRN